MFRTIVIGFEGPDRSGEAVALAEALRDPSKGTLLLASAYPIAALLVGGYVVPEELYAVRDDTKRQLVEARSTLPAADRVRIRAIPSESVERTLTELAGAEHADLLVVGSSHRGKVGRVLLGTTAEQVLQHAPCAVAVAPRGYERDDIRHIGVAYEGSPEAEAALRAAEALALELGAALTVYCVVEPPPTTDTMIAAGTGAEWPSVTAKQHGRQLLYYVADHAPQGLKLKTVLLHGHAAEQIARRTDGVVDLLFVGSRGRGPLRRALLGSVSGELVRDAGCPVVITPRSAVVALRGVTPPAQSATA